MPGDSCREFFAAHADDSQKVKALQKLPLAVLLVWEKESASDHSPGPVESDEVLYRQLLQPLHIDPETQKLKPTAFDDVANKGLSVERLKYKDLETIIADGQARAARQRAENKALTDRKFHGVAIFKSADIRGITDNEGTRYFGVYDTAIPENCAHADVCQLLGGKKVGRSARSRLIDAVVSINPV